MGLTIRNFAPFADASSVPGIASPVTLSPVTLSPVTLSREPAAVARRRSVLANLIVIVLTWLSPVGLRARVVAGEATAEITRPIRSERNLIYRQVDDQQLRADLYRPADDQEYPLVIMIHGGAWSAGDKWQVQDHAREMAQAGFVALNINYRLAPQYPITAQIEDCRYALRWAVERAGEWRADPERVALWGYSAGGHLAALIATNSQHDEPELSGVVAGGAPCEFSFIPLESPAMSFVFGGTRAENPQGYEQAAPVTFASADDCPFFFFHGSADGLVPPSSSRQLHNKLQSLGVRSDYHVVEGRGHLLTFIDHQARREAIQFLRSVTAEGQD